MRMGRQWTGCLDKGMLENNCRDEDTDKKNVEYYGIYKCRETPDLTGHFKTFWVTGFPKWKILLTYCLLN